MKSPDVDSLGLSKGLEILLTKHIWLGLDVN